MVCGCSNCRPKSVRNLCRDIQGQQHAVGHLALQGNGLAVARKRRAQREIACAVRDIDSACAVKRFAECDGQRLAYTNARRTFSRITGTRESALLSSVIVAQIHSLTVRAH